MARPAHFDLEAYSRIESNRKVAALVDGLHYTRHVQAVKAALRAGDDDAAAGLLIRLVEAVEREARFPLPGMEHVVPWYHHQLAAIYLRAGLREEAMKMIGRHTQCQIESTRLARSVREGIGWGRGTTAKHGHRNFSYQLGRLLGHFLLGLLGRR
jgi:hypothetical protein